MLSSAKIKAVNDLLTLGLHVAERDRTRLRLAEKDSERLAVEIEALTAKPTRTHRQAKPQPAKTCDKRPFPSENAAIRSCTQLKHTVRAYCCPECRQWHITKADYK